jgi:Cft2 family RNA processing exonuclease
MDFNTTLKQFIQSVLLDDYGNFDMSTLPINVRSYIEEKAQHFCKIERMVSTEDILKNWGEFDSFQKWKENLLNHVNEVNFSYVLGKVSALKSVWLMYQVDVNSVDPDDINFNELDIFVFSRNLLEVNGD